MSDPIRHPCPKLDAKSKDGKKAAQECFERKIGG